MADNVINRRFGHNYLRDEASFIQNKLTLTTYSNSTVSIIHAGMFKNCSLLTAISLPNVTTIEAEAFQNCTALESVALPKIVYVGSSAFNGCTELTTVALYNANLTQPGETATIDLSAFHGCTKLSTLYLGYTVPPVINGTPNSTFSGTLLQNATSTKGNIYVMTSVGSSTYYQTLYRSALGWSKNNLKSKVRANSDLYPFT